jgi:hypothetical protein
MPDGKSFNEFGLLVDILAHKRLWGLTLLLLLLGQHLGIPTQVVVLGGIVLVYR